MSASPFPTMSSTSWAMIGVRIRLPIRVGSLRLFHSDHRMNHSRVPFAPYFCLVGSEVDFVAVTLIKLCRIFSLNQFLFD